MIACLVWLNWLRIGADRVGQRDFNPVAVMKKSSGPQTLSTVTLFIQPLH